MLEKQECVTLLWLRTYLLKQLLIIKVRMLWKQTCVKPHLRHCIFIIDRLKYKSLLYSKSVNLVDYTYNTYIAVRYGNI